ncbi:uncharacterized protein LOC111561823 isoform X2 [Felis catus]|uniref:uncharacterized protein LOC111561823 isoform X2 n=1 Tax=Felis catus TaxID=9685 RepID=UPI001D19F18A|nr:uncharacterized protein LOC111561823 isoform X2 [Felis catus]
MDITLNSETKYLVWQPRGPCGSDLPWRKNVPFNYWCAGSCQPPGTSPLGSITVSELLEAVCTLAHGTFLHLQSQQRSIFKPLPLPGCLFCCHSSFTDLILLPPSQKDTCDYRGPTWLIQDSAGMQRAGKRAQLVSQASSWLPWRNQDPFALSSLPSLPSCSPSSLGTKSPSPGACFRWAKPSPLLT